MNKRSGEETKRLILAAARKSFVGQGFAQASMRDIAQEAGVSVGCLYVHFRNKEELYKTLQREWMDRLAKDTSAALVSCRGPVEAIAAFISTSIEFAGRHRETIHLLGREIGISFGDESKRQFFRERRRLVADIIDQGIAAGSFSPCDSGEAAKVIFNMLRGFIFSMVIDEEALFSPEGCIDLVLNGLTRRVDR
jgi:AcrR family transcriptional regulator